MVLLIQWVWEKGSGSYGTAWLVIGLVYLMVMLIVNSFSRPTDSYSTGGKKGNEDSGGSS